jgi:hypothetical protein
MDQCFDVPYTVKWLDESGVTVLGRSTMSVCQGGGSVIGQILGFLGVDQAYIDEIRANIAALDSGFRPLLSSERREVRRAIGDIGCRWARNTLNTLLTSNRIDVRLDFRWLNTGWAAAYSEFGLGVHDDPTATLHIFVLELMEPQLAHLAHTLAHEAWHIHNGNPDDVLAELSARSCAP